MVKTVTDVCLKTFTDLSAGSAMKTSIMRRSSAWPYCMSDKADIGKVLVFKLI